MKTRSSSTLHVAISPLTQRIYAGRVAKDGCTWLAGRQDVTSEALEAVIKKVGAGNIVSVHVNGEPAYEIEVRDVRKNREHPSSTASTADPDRDGRELT